MVVFFFFLLTKLYKTLNFCCTIILCKNDQLHLHRFRIHGMADNISYRVAVSEFSLGLTGKLLHNKIKCLPEKVKLGLHERLTQISNQMRLIQYVLRFQHKKEVAPNKSLTLNLSGQIL